MPKRDVIDRKMEKKKRKKRTKNKNKKTKSKKQKTKKKQKKNKNKKKNKILVLNSVHTRSGQENYEKNSKKIQKIIKPLHGISFNQNGMR